MKHIVFLDDDPRRSDAFRKVYPHAVIVETALAAMQTLRKRKHWDWVSLDYDLDGGGFRDDLPDDDSTGMWVVEDLLWNPRSVHKLTVHSLNGPAARLMHETLLDDYPHVTLAPWPSVLPDAARFKLNLTAPPDIWWPRPWASDTVRA